MPKKKEANEISVFAIYAYNNTTTYRFKTRITRGVNVRFDSKLWITNIKKYMKYV